MLHFAGFEWISTFALIYFHIMYINYIHKGSFENLLYLYILLNISVHNNINRNKEILLVKVLDKIPLFSFSKENTGHCELPSSLQAIPEH